MNVGEFDPMKFLSNTKKDDNAIVETEPPVEDVLLTRSLWPERAKFYGHQFEIFAMAVTHKGDLAASACKAKDK